MRIKVLLFVIIILLGLVKTQPIPPCATDMDCNMNGVCVNQACTCDYSWSGPTCTYLNFNTAPVAGSYGYTPNISAWGGVPVYSREDKNYHLFVAEMVDNCGLCTWETNSRIIHAVSDTVLGPYIFSDVALSVWAHNPAIAVDYSSGSPVYLLFHIGNGLDGNPTVCNKTNTKKSFSPSSSFSFSSSSVANSSGVLHTSASPYGPWTPQNPEGLPNCNNPAPYIFPNGTIYVACSPMWSSNGPSLFFADTWKGPWKSANLTYSGDLGLGIWEDPFIWVDKRGVFKMLSHVYPSPSDQSIPFWARVSGFAYSFDALHWVVNPIQPYSNVVSHVDGLAAYTTRERPKIFFDPLDPFTPLALFNGVAEGANCWSCKSICGSDWTYNIAVPIAP